MGAVSQSPRPTLSFWENTYRARGFSRWLMNWMASSRLRTHTMGMMGPKISSCITGDSGSTSVRMVGAEAGSKPVSWCQELTPPGLSRQLAASFTCSTDKTVEA